jgi:hypothetical protein
LVLQSGISRQHVEKLTPHWQKIEIEKNSRCNIADNSITENYLPMN